MRRNAFALSAIAVTAVIASSTLGLAEDGERLRELRREVRTLEVLKALELTPAQLKQLHTLATQASELRLAHKQDVESIRATAGELLGKRRDQILRNEEMSGVDQKQVDSLRSEYQERHKDLSLALETVAAEAKKVLSEEQVLQLKQKMGHGKRESRKGGGPEALEDRIGKGASGERGEAGDLGGRHGKRDGDQAGGREGRHGKRDGGEAGDRGRRHGKRDGGEAGERGRRHGKHSKHGLGRWLADPSTGKALESLMGQI